MLRPRRNSAAHPFAEFGLDPAGWRELLDLLARARHVKVFSGAGLAVASGLPTFRGSGDALWSRLSYEELSTLEGYQSNPSKVWAWYVERAEQLREARPNAAHASLAALEHHFTVTHYTQNVDDLLERAGCTRVHHLHGQMARPRCMGCGQPGAYCKAAGPTPVCKDCGALMRPDVVWFGEDLPEPLFSQARESAVEADLWLAVGTAADVYPAASLPETAAAQGVPLVCINPEPTSLSDISTFDLRGPAERVLPYLLARLAHQPPAQSKALPWWQRIIARWAGV